MLKIPALLTLLVLATPLVSSATTVRHQGAYPTEALAACIEGSVKLQLEILSDGSIKEIVVLSSEPEGVFDAAAIDAASKLHLEQVADKIGGKPVLHVMTFSFELDECENEATAP